MPQVITIGADGSLSGLQVKPGRGIDLTKFGNASVKRASEILWDEAEQKWYIDVLQEAGNGIVSNLRFIAGTGLGFLNAQRKLNELVGEGRWDCGSGKFDNPIEGKLLFDTYDDAVKVEIFYLDALRLKGQF